MLKKILTFACAATVAGAAASQAQERVQLPKPLTDNTVSLTESLQNRHSSREFSAKEIPDDVLSTILWSACGVNRPESGRITAPSAINAQDVIVYVVRKDGAFRYEPADNSLVKVSGEDLRPAVAGGQEFAASAPLSLVLVSDHGKFPGQMPEEAKTRMGLLDAGYVSENICLICSALNLNTVPRMSMDSASLKKAIGLDDNCDLALNSQIGYPVE